MLQTRRTIELAELSFLAHVALLGLLLYVFRRTERWLHQHLFKVGWLLTQDNRTTTILYYILFLPGILLHELARWLAAGLLNVWAERAIQFPEPQDIGELRLNFIRIAAETGVVKRLIIGATPLALGLTALWAIGAYIFNWQSLVSIAAPGNLDDLLLAISTLAKTADFWLWFYLAFTIANTMYPAPSSHARASKKTGLAVVSLLLILLIGGAANAEFAGAMEGVLSNLSLVTLQIALINLVAVLALGSLEAAVERLTGKSAAFTDGKMITLTRREAQQFKSSARPERREARADEPQPKDPKAPKSVYDLKLPIPGPPGREPISRTVAAVVAAPSANPAAAAIAAEAEKRHLAPAKPPQEKQKLGIESAGMTILQEPEPRPQRVATGDSKTTPEPNPGDGEAAFEARAPFQRPFVKEDLPDEAAELSPAARETAQDEPFARPFAAPGSPSRGKDAAGERDAASWRGPAAAAAAGESEEEPVAAERRPRHARRMRPAPKPSQRKKAANDRDKDLMDEELRYEDLEDD